MRNDACLRWLLLFYRCSTTNALRYLISDFLKTLIYPTARLCTYSSLHVYCQSWAPTVKILIANRLHHSTTYVWQPTLDNLLMTTDNRQMPTTVMTNNQQKNTQYPTHNKKQPTVKTFACALLVTYLNVALYRYLTNALRYLISDFCKNITLPIRKVMYSILACTVRPGHRQSKFSSTTDSTTQQPMSDNRHSTT